MSNKRRPLFDLRPDEGHRVVRAGAAMFAILAAHTIAETARDAMFLRALPPTELPLVYCALAVLAIAALRISTVMVRRVGRRLALVATLWASAIGTLGFHLLPATGAAAFALYLWTGLLGTIIVVQFWLLAGELFTTTQGKRLFGPIAALGACGTLAGAWAASAVLTFLPVQDLLLMSAICYLIAARILRGGRIEVIRPRRLVRDPTLAAGAWARLREQPYLRRLAALMALTTAAALVADYLFKVTVAAAVPAGELPGFFARFNGVVGAVSLLLQLVGASWLLRRLGVVGALVILPLCLLIGGIASVALVGGLAAVVLTKGADGTLRHSVNRVAGELLWMPLPEPERPMVREPLDSLGIRLVQAAVAAGLLIASLAGFARPTVLAAVLATVAAIWLAVALTMRRAYLDRLRQSLARPAFAFDQDLDLASIEVVVEALSSTEPRRVIAAMQVLSERGRSRLVPALILLHDAPAVLLEALRIVAVPGRRDWRPLGGKLTEHAVPAVRAAALRALVRAGDRSRLEGAAADPDPTLRAHAAFWLAAAGDGGDLADDPRIAALVADPGPDGDRGRLALLAAIRDDGDPRWGSVLLALLRRGDAPTVDAVVLATERVPEVRLLPVLVDRLGVRSGRASVRGALVRLGEPARIQLERAFADPATPRRVRLHIPASIAQFGTPRAGDFLLHALRAERSGAVRYRILRALARLAIHRGVRLDRTALIVEMQRHLREHFRLLALCVVLDREPASGDAAELLRGLLGDKRDQALERVFLLLQAAHPREDVRGVEQAIGSGDRTARAHAVEFFDNLTRAAPYQQPAAAGLRELLTLAIDDLPAAEKVERAGDAIVDPPADAADALDRLVRDDDQLVASIAAPGLGTLELAHAR